MDRHPVVIVGNREYASDSFLVLFQKDCGFSSEESAAKAQSHLLNSFREDGLEFSFRVNRFFALLQVQYPSTATHQEVLSFYGKIKQELLSLRRDVIKDVGGNRILRG